MIHGSKKVLINLQSGIVEYKLANGNTMLSRLGKKDLEVLLYLIEHVGRIVSKDEILETVWANKIVGDNTVSVALSNIRRFLKKADEDCSCLTNLSGSGYIFVPSRSGFKLEEVPNSVDVAI